MPNFFNHIRQNTPILWANFNIVLPHQKLAYKIYFTAF